MWREIIMKRWEKILYCVVAFALLSFIVHQVTGKGLLYRLLELLFGKR